MADETTDISNIEQLSLCVRYVDINNRLNEDFLQFVPIHSLTGSDLAASILQGLSDCGINCDYIYMDKATMELVTWLVNLREFKQL